MTYLIPTTQVFRYSNMASCFSCVKLGLPETGVAIVALFVDTPAQVGPDSGLAVVR